MNHFFLRGSVIDDEVRGDYPRQAVETRVYFGSEQRRTDRPCYYYRYCYSTATVLRLESTNAENIAKMRQGQ
jgi:hypothetical protein